MTVETMGAITVAYTPEAFPALWETTITKPSCPIDGALIRTLGGGLCGTDVEKIQQQKVPVGTILGHEMVGEIVELGANYTPNSTNPETCFSVGDRLVIAHHVPCGICHFCLNASPSSCEAFKASNLVPGGFTQFFTVSQGHLHHTCFKVPSHIATREAACTEPLACVLRAVRRVGNLHNGSVAVVGLGFIGLLASQVFKHQGWQVLGLDINPNRLALASITDYCHSVAHPTEQEPYWQEWLEAQPTGKVDVVCLTVVNEATLALALQMVRNGGTLLLMAGQGKQPVSLNPSVLYYREINVVTSYSPALEDLQQAFKLITTRAVSLTPLLTHPLSIHQFAEGFKAYTQGEAIKVIFSFAEDGKLV
ncbi:MAG: alcohol dehydrogenase catalytic domain-containing protein [Vampirovibrio sp.]|nr:alcohol dehydrogenase catalytic domain-containing protein [Vampirovibrio sp.]